MDYGYYADATATEPAFDPGLTVDCPVCHKLLSMPVKTISLMAAGDNRSYFYRTHKACYEGLTPQQESDLDGLIIDHVDTLRNTS